MNYQENLIRKLAFSEKYRTLYARSKENANIKLFLNNIDFTESQLECLRWSEVAYSLYNKMYAGDELLSPEIIQDEIECNAYLIYKHKCKEEKNSMTPFTRGDLIKPKIIGKKRGKK